MSVCKSTLHKIFKDFIKKKFNADKNKNKNYNKSDKNIQLFIFNQITNLNTVIFSTANAITVINIVTK